MNDNRSDAETATFNALDATPFRLPGSAHPRIGSFYQLWLRHGGGDLPPATAFNLARLSGDYPLLARIGVEGPELELIWREVSDCQVWPFAAPVAGARVIASVPQPSIARVNSAFHRTLSSGVPDYFETTSWMHGGRTLSLARLVVPVSVQSGRELLSLWEAMDPPLPKL